MGTVSVSRNINASSDAVWALVSDLPRMGEWSPENKGGEWLGGATGPALGAKFKGNNTNGKKKWSTTATVTECVPGREFGFDVVSGPVKVAHWGYAIESTGAGTCIVTESTTDRRSKFAARFGKLFSGVADRAVFNKQSIEETLAAIDAAATGAKQS